MKAGQGREGGRGNEMGGDFRDVLSLFHLVSLGGQHGYSPGSGKVAKLGTGQNLTYFVLDPLTSKQLATSPVSIERWSL